MAAVTDVQRLQARVEELERWVYGPSGSHGSRKVADNLVKVQVALGNIASKRERVKILYKKIEDLIKYLDPEYMDRIAIPDASKLQFILAAVPEHAACLQRLAQIHIQQQDQCVEITEESKALLEEYNKTVSFLFSQAPESYLKPCSFVPSLAVSHPIPTSQSIPLLPQPFFFVVNPHPRIFFIDF
uniref:Dynactin subunit 3 n=1 Tax=Molossus molossus TaxID=27622 RepID=A0A7J8EDF5_MOLMO|nr:dynactin subunit 3 [Molossus molossus]